MQRRGRRGDGAGSFGENGLIPVAVEIVEVIVVFVAVDVRRKWHSADAGENFDSEVGGRYLDFKCSPRQDSAEQSPSKPDRRKSPEAL